MRILYLSLIIVLIDQGSKLLIKGFSIPLLNLNHKGMYPGQRINLVGDWFNFTFVENPGIAFGIDFGGEYKLLISLFVIFATLALFLYLYFMRDKNPGIKLSLAFIISGAVGNLIDRIFYGWIYGYAPILHGKVVDFIDIRIFDLFSFSQSFGNYIFNIADLSVTTGIALFLISGIRQKNEEETGIQQVININSETKE